MDGKIYSLNLSSFLIYNYLNLVSASPNEKTQRSYDDLQIIHQYSPVCAPASDQVYLPLTFYL